MSPRPSLLQRLGGGWWMVWQRFPWVLLCGWVWAAVASLSLHRDRFIREDVCVRIGFAAALGVPLFFTLRIVSERLSKAWRFPLALAGGALLAAWYARSPVKPFGGPEIFWFQTALLFAALNALSAASAYAVRPETSGFWQWNRHLFLRFFLATLYAGVLTAGLELALFSADHLFSLNLSGKGYDKGYGYLFFAMVGGFHPAFFLGGVPGDFQKLETESDYPRGLKAFTQFALAPLAAVYTGILYLYAGKILLARQWPHGWVALPVLLLAVVGMLAVLLLYPLRDREGEVWASWFHRWFPRALAPLSILLLLSLQERIAAYGITEERYLGAVAGVWILVWSLVFIVCRSPKIRWIPVSLAAIALLAAYGPWSAGAISNASQMSHLQKALVAQRILQEGKIILPADARTIPAKDYEQIESILKYLNNVHGGRSLQPLLGTALPKAKWDEFRGYNAGEEILKLLKLKSGPREYGYRVATLEPASALPLQGFQRLWQVNSRTSNSDWSKVRRQVGEWEIGILNNDLQIAAQPGAKPEPVPASRIVTFATDAAQSKQPVEKMSLDWSQDGRECRIVFTRIEYRLTPDSKRPIEIEAAEILLLER